jgi:hypothetical protein
VKHTQPQPAKPGLPVLDLADWRASDLDANRRRWVFDRDELVKAAASVRRVIGVRLHSPVARIAL